MFNESIFISLQCVVLNGFFYLFLCFCRVYFRYLYIEVEYYRVIKVVLFGRVVFVQEVCRVKVIFVVDLSNIFFQFFEYIFVDEFLCIKNREVNIFNEVFFSFRVRDVIVNICKVVENYCMLDVSYVQYCLIVGSIGFKCSNEILDIFNCLCVLMVKKRRGIFGVVEIFIIRLVVISCSQVLYYGRGVNQNGMLVFIVFI